MALTEAEFEVLHGLSLRPGGALIRPLDLRQAVLDLADRQLVCDPHTMENGLFTRITDKGKAALAANPQ